MSARRWCVVVERQPRGPHGETRNTETVAVVVEAPHGDAAHEAARALRPDLWERREIPGRPGVEPVRTTVCPVVDGAA